MRVFEGAVLAVCLRLVAACGGSAVSSNEPEPPTTGPSQPTFVEGARLVAQYWQIDDQPVFERWWDSERQEACTFGPASGDDGVFHCLPPMAQVYDTFADADCTRPLVFAPSSLKYATTFPLDSCSGHQAVFELGEPALVTEAFGYSAGGSCVSNTQLVGMMMRSALRQVPLPEFVAATEEHDVTSGRIGTVTLAATDGSRQLFTGWDAQRNEASSPRSMVRWQPERTVYYQADRHEFADARCTVPVALHWNVGAISCPATAIIDVANPDDVYELGARITDSYYQRYEGECQALAPPSTETQLYRLGAKVPAAELEPARLVQVGQGRVRSTYYAGRAGVAAVPAGWVSFWGGGDALPHVRMLDSRRNDACTIVDQGVDVARCLPVYVGLYFGDSACTQPVCVTSSGAPTPTACRMTAPWAVDEPVEVRAVTHVHSGPLYFDDGTGFTGGGCQPASKIAAYAPAKGYDLGEPVPLEEFEPATWHGQPR